MNMYEFAEKMREIYPEDRNYDIVAAHREADQVMLDILEGLGYGTGVAIFKAAQQWYNL